MISCCTLIETSLSNKGTHLYCVNCSTVTFLFLFFISLQFNLYLMLHFVIMIVILDPGSLYFHIFVYSISNRVASMSAANICLVGSLLNPYYIMLIILYAIIVKILGSINEFLSSESQLPNILESTLMKVWNGINILIWLSSKSATNVQHWCGQNLEKILLLWKPMHTTTLNI